MLASITEKSRESDRFVLPPIRTLDEYIPKKESHDQHTSNNNNNNFTMLSPPNSYSSSTISPPCSTSGHSPILIQRPPSPPRTASEKMDTPIYPLGGYETASSISTNTNTNVSSSNKNTLHTVSSDVEQVVRQANSLCNNMVHYKPYLLSTNTTPHHDEELRPWMDDMIGKANQVLNALLRLRKHQMVSSPTTQAMTGSSDHSTTAPFASASPPTSYTFSSTFSSLRSPPSSSSSSSTSSSQITLTKRDWSNTTSRYQYPYYHHRQLSAEMTSIPSRQRKRGKRATFQGRCHSCNISETPEWRRGPDGARTLCNACGLHYAKLARKKAASSSNQKNQVSSR